MATYEHAWVEQLRRLLDAVMVVASEFSLPVILRRITEAATELVGARYGALGVLDQSRTALAEFITVGMSDEQIHHIGPLPEGHGILGLLIVDPVPLRLPDLNAHPDRYGFPPNHPPMSSFLGVPILLRDEVFGNFYFTDKAGGGPFSDGDEELVVALAAAAGLAVENARLHQYMQVALLLEERERIARDLHDDVIQRVFAAGLTLQSTAQLSTEPAVTQRLTQVVNDLDVTVQQVRNAIFQLNHAGTGSSSVRADVMAICSEATSALGFPATCLVRGPVDSMVSEQVAPHLILTLREALSNVARHAHASTATVRLTANGGQVVLEVSDDGIGVGAEPAGAGHGLSNMRDRANAVGGTFTVVPADPTGTVVTWSAPLN